MKTNNKGFTLIELIVVIVIIGIMAGLVGLSVSSVSSVNARRNASSVDSLISKCRTGSLSRAGDVHLTLSLDSNGDIVGYYYENGLLVSTDKFSGHKVTVTYTTKLGASETLVSLEGHPLTLSFDRATGAQKPQSDGSYCTAIAFTNNQTYTITLVPSTGNHRLA